MPLIIVLADCGDKHHKEVVMEERVVPAHLDSDHSAAQLMQRIGWAISDADDLEQAETGRVSPGAPIDQDWARAAF
jgi:hypothetical protein